MNRYGWTGFLSLTAAAILLSGCGNAATEHQDVLSNPAYWRDFFGPGDTSKSEIPDVAVATLSGGSANKEASAMEQNIAAMRELFNESGTYERSFPLVEQHYDSIVARLNKGLTGKTPGKDMSDADRRIASSLITSAVASIEIQNQRIQSARGGFDQKVMPVLEKAGELERQCNPGAGGAPAPQGCPAFLNALSLFRVRVEVANSGFAHLNEVYAQARRSEEIAARPFQGQ